MLDNSRYLEVRDRQINSTMVPWFGFLVDFFFFSITSVHKLKQT